MGWEPNVRKHKRKGRRPWYTLQACEKQRYPEADGAKTWTGRHCVHTLDD